MTDQDSLKLLAFIDLKLLDIQSSDGRFTLTFTGGKKLDFSAEPVGYCNSRSYIILDDGSEIMAD